MLVHERFALFLVNSIDGVGYGRVMNEQNHIFSRILCIVYHHQIRYHASRPPLAVLKAHSIADGTRLQW